MALGPVCGEAEHHGDEADRKHVVGQDYGLLLDRGQRQTEKDPGRDGEPKDTPPVACFFTIGPTPLVKSGLTVWSLLSGCVQQLRNKLSAHEPLGSVGRMLPWRGMANIYVLLFRSMANQCMVPSEPSLEHQECIKLNYRT